MAERKNGRTDTPGPAVIPAMTSRAEQECFNRLAREQAPYGAIVELGAWLGACTVAIANGIKQSGMANVVHSYDRFKWNQRSHGPKSGLTISNMFEAYRQNIAPVSSYVHPHKCEITDARWDDGTISLLVSDGPKRFKVVQHALSEFGSWLCKGSVMAWQDFCFPPAYAIPASLYRLRQHCTYREYAPDCTVAFDITGSWQKQDVTLSALQDGWTLAEIAAAVDYWRGVLPDKAYAGAACCLAMFLSDLGHVEAAKVLAKQSDIAPLKTIAKTHPRLRAQYQDLFRVIA